MIIRLVGSLVVLLATCPSVTTAGATSPAETKVVAAGGTGHNLARSDVEAWLDGYMPSALRRGDIAGAVVVVVKDGAILTQRGYGWANVAQSTPVDPRRTLFRPGSIAKLFTWTAVMQLVEQGKLELDADINQYLDFEIPEREGQPVTLRNILTHTPGFDDTARNVLFNDPARLMSLADYVKEWTPKRVYAPGGTPSYSNYGTALAGYIVQRISGQPYDEYIEEHIFRPLDMQLSTFRQPLPAHLQTLMSLGYGLASGEPSKFELVGPAPAGSLSASGTDIGHFMIAHLQNGEFRGNRILRTETAKMMHDSPLTLLLPLNRMELGFFEGHINGRRVIRHFGDTVDFHSTLHLFLDEGAGFYVSFNSLGKDGASSQLRFRLFEDFSDRYFPAASEEDAAHANPGTPVSPAEAQMLVGRWASSRSSSSSFLAIADFLNQLDINVGPEGELSIPAWLGSNGQPRQWTQIAPLVWRDAGGHERLAAKVADGRAIRLSVDLIAPFMVFERPPWYQNSAWLKPLFFASLSALMATLLAWPTAALVRRHYRVKLALTERDLRARSLSRIGAIAILAALAVWMGTVAVLLSDLNNATARFDAVIWSAQIFGTIAFLGGGALILWHTRLVCTGKRGWPAKLWSATIGVSALAVIWVAVAFNLIDFGAHY